MSDVFSASSAAKYIACPASANLSAAIPTWTPPDVPDIKASVKGTDIHELFERMGEYTAREMEGIAKALLYVAELRKTRRFKFERELSGEGHWLRQRPAPRTTADAVLYVQDEIHVIDYKFGKIEVSAFDNAQGKYYACAFRILAPRAKGVWFHIVQPFIENVEAVFFTNAELDAFEDECRQAEAKIKAGDTTFGPGDHCTFCPANPHGRGVKGSPKCPALLDILYPPTPLDEDAIFDLL